MAVLSSNHDGIWYYHYHFDGKYYHSTAERKRERESAQERERKNEREKVGERGGERASERASERVRDSNIFTRT